MSANHEDNDDMAIIIDEHEVFEEEEDIPQAGEKVKEPRIRFDSHGKPKPFFDPNYTYIFYECFNLPEELLDGTPIVVKPMANLNFDQIMEVITNDIQDDQPKMLTLACLDHLIPKMAISDLMKGVKKLDDMAKKGGIHYFSVATQIFIPNNPQDWYKKAQVNAELRGINIDNNVPPFGLHKCLMMPLYITYGPLTCQGKMWSEFVANTGLGSTLSPDGMERIAHFTFLACGLQFEDIQRNESRRWIGLPVPTRLSLTDDYTNNEVMCQIMRERGLFNLSSNPANNPQQQPQPPQPQDVNERDSIEDEYIKTIDELNEKLANLTLENIRDKKAMEDQHKRNIASLNNDISNYQASEENQYRKISKYKEEIKKLKLDKDKLNQDSVDQHNKVVQDLKEGLRIQLDKFNLLQEQYNFLRRIHDERSKLINDEWLSMVQTLQRGGVNFADHFENVTNEMNQEWIDKLSGTSDPKRNNE